MRSPTSWPTWARSAPISRSIRSPRRLDQLQTQAIASSATIVRKSLSSRRQLFTCARMRMTAANPASFSQL
jgi:hypothetical protein